MGFDRRVALWWLVFDHDQLMQISNASVNWFELLDQCEELP